MRFEKDGSQRQTNFEIYHPLWQRREGSLKAETMVTCFHYVLSDEVAQQVC